MEVVRNILIALQVLVSLTLVLTVIFQSGKQGNTGASVDGIADTFFSKNKARSIDQKLEKLTGFVAIAFIVLTFAITLVK